MTISVRDDAERAALDATLALINGGSGDASGDFELLTGALSTLANLAFTVPGSGGAFAAASSNAGIAQAISNAIANSGTPTAGDIGAGRFRDRANSAVVSFSISTAIGSGDMKISDVTIPGNATAVSCSSITVTMNITN